jgi:hypothetical protein
MRLPEATWQLAYGHLAWALVLAALAATLLARALSGRAPWAPTMRWAMPLIVAGAVALPGPASPVYWLGLAFQWPSVLLSGLCAISLWRQWSAHNPANLRMPVPLAAGVAVLGTLLYADAMGWLALGWYAAGFAAYWAPATGAVLAVLATGCLWVQPRRLRTARPFPAALLAACTAYAVLRLPTGNLWDALLDPFVWGWAIMALVVAAGRRLRVRIQPAPHLSKDLS